MSKKNYTIAKSKALLNRYGDVLVRGYIPHKNIFGQVDMDYPAFVQRAAGARFWDVDGNEFLDYVMGFGPIVLGYDDPAVCRAIHEQVANGTVYSLAYPRELTVAELLIEVIPCAEMVGFFIGGSAATSSAVRLSRVYTGRDRVITCGYHGWHDWARPGDEGVPKIVSELTCAVPYGDLDALEACLKKYDNQVACVVMET
ncbi:MAG: aminotransferase class III-fold pyridoxal phosphate-dependent enzyme, partial [Gemmatimonadetes bacterium]|nr:aminotransferase class III-fold pyridoxal phosphate-dependent enzyme [Gemmatimonadota bacterium]